MPFEVSWPSCSCGPFDVTCVFTPPADYEPALTDSQPVANTPYTYTFTHTYTHITDPPNNAPITESATGTIYGVIQPGGPYASISISAPYSYSGQKWTDGSDVTVSASAGGTSCFGGSQVGPSIASGVGTLLGSTLTDLNTVESYSTVTVTGYNNCGGSLTRTDTVYIDLYTPVSTYTAPTIVSPYTGEWLGINKTSAFSGQLLFTDTLATIVDLYLDYTTNSSPTVAYSPITATNNYTVPLSTIHENVATLAGLANGSNYYLHSGVQDIVKHESSVETVPFQIDNDYPSFYDLEFNSGLTQLSGHEIVISGECSDPTSGVVYFEPSDGISSPTYNSSYLLTTNYVEPNRYIFHLTAPISTTPGLRTFYLHIIDQANNITTESYSYNHDGCDLVWNNLYGTRSTISPFIVNGDFDAEIIGCATNYIQGFFASSLFGYTPALSDFDFSSGVYQHYLPPNTNFSLLVLQSNSANGVIHLTLTSGAFSSNTFSYDPIDYTTLTYDPPTLSIAEENNRVYTNQLTRTYSIQIDRGDIFDSSLNNLGGDLIIGYKISESSSLSLAEMPTYDPITGKFSSAAGNWQIFDSGISSVTTLDPYTFATNVFEMKHIYLHVATVAYSGEVIPSQKQFFTSTSYDIEYINDFLGPKATNVKVDGNSTVVTGTEPNQTHNSAPYVTSTQNITITGDLTDIGTTPTLIEKWCLNTSSAPPAYTSSQWTTLSTPSLTVSFTKALTLPPMNGVKTVYLHAIDVVGNLSKNLIKVELNSPSYVFPAIGIVNGQQYKFEGNIAEHDRRATIASMFGNGVGHTGFISKLLNDKNAAHYVTYEGISSHRVHNIRDYRGLRVLDQTTLDLENLPEDPLKFSDFVNKIPRISGLTINSSLTDDMLTITIPTIAGQQRYIALQLDIDTGNTSFSYINSQVIDIHTDWIVTFLSEDGLTFTQYTQGTDFTVTDGVIQNFTFTNAGIYNFIGLGSFGINAATSYIIYPTGSVAPPVEDPPIDVDIPIGSSGTTTVTVDFNVTQLSLGIDAVFVMDASYSYIPTFSSRLSSVLDTICDKIDEFAYNSDTGLTDSRYGLVTFASTQGPSNPHVEQKVAFTSSRTPVASAISSHLPTGYFEARIEAVGKTAEGYFPGLQWRNNVIRMLMLFSDETDAQYYATEWSSKAQYREPSGSNYYVNSLVDNKITFVYFDAGAINTTLGLVVKDQDYLPQAISQTSDFGSILTTLSTSASAAQIGAALDPVFTAYQNHVEYGMESDITSPMIITGSVANSIHGIGSASTIPYTNLIPVAGTPQIARFDVTLDNNEINNFGVEHITAYVTIYDPSGNPLKKRMIRIHLVA